MIPGIHQQKEIDHLFPAETKNPVRKGILHRTIAFRYGKLHSAVVLSRSAMEICIPLWFISFRYGKFRSAMVYRISRWLEPVRHRILHLGIVMPVSWKKTSIIPVYYQQTEVSRELFQSFKLWKSLP